MNKLKITGLIAAPFTPMHQDGSLNLSKIEDYANSLKKDGVIGAFICGTTGEGMLMNDEERMSVANEWIKFKASDFKIIVHVGSTAYKSSEKLAAHAEKIRADGIGAMGPVFLPPSDAESLIDYCQPIAKAASKLPFYYYHIPSVSNVFVSMKDFLLEAHNRIPNLVGIKFTHNNLMEMQQCMALNNGQFEILHGYDEVLLGGLALGAKGAVGSTYNYMAGCYQNIMHEFDNGNITEARKLQLVSVEVVEVLIKYGGGVRAGKAIMGLKGFDCGPARAPIKKFNKQELLNLRTDLEKTEFFKNK